MIVDLVELGKLEEDNLVKVDRLQVPILNHPWCEISPLILRYVQSRGVVLRIIWTPSVLVSDPIGMEEVRQGFDQISVCHSFILLRALTIPLGHGSTRIVQPNLRFFLVICVQGIFHFLHDISSCLRISPCLEVVHFLLARYEAILPMWIERRYLAICQHLILF